MESARDLRTLESPPEKNTPEALFQSMALCRIDRSKRPYETHEPPCCCLLAYVFGIQPAVRSNAKFSTVSDQRGPDNRLLAAKHLPTDQDDPKFNVSANP